MAINSENLPPILTNPDRIGLDEAYLMMTDAWRLRSHANRKRVGSLLVKNRQIITDGYNGMPADSADEVCEIYDDLGNLVTKPEVRHAEHNALDKLERNGGPSPEGGTLYISMSPCKNCAQMIVKAKIARVVFREQYRLTDGTDHCRENGVEVTHLPWAPEAASEV